MDNTFRDPKMRGCGVGDIRAMLESGNLSGKCADLDALYVGLARSVAIPSRDVHGVRVGTRGSSRASERAARSPRPNPAGPSPTCSASGK